MHWSTFGVLGWTKSATHMYTLCAFRLAHCTDACRNEVDSGRTGREQYQLVCCKSKWCCYFGEVFNIVPIVELRCETAVDADTSVLLFAQAIQCISVCMSVLDPRFTSVLRQPYEIGLTNFLWQRMTRPNASREKTCTTRILGFKRKSRQCRNSCLAMLSEICFPMSLKS